jgi:hypothetical protein
LQPIQPAEIARQSTNLFSATEIAETIGADLETINAWLESGAIDRAVFGGGRISKYELQRAALTFALVKFGLSPLSARDRRHCPNRSWYLQESWRFSAQRKRELLSFLST